MAVTYGQEGYYSSVTGQNYVDADSAHAAESAVQGNDLTGGAPAYGGGVSGTSGIQAADSGSSASGFTDPNSPAYKGPGYYVTTDNNGNSVARLSDDPNLRARQTEYENSKGGPGAIQAPADPNGDPMAVVNDTYNKYGGGAGSAPTPAQNVISAGATPGQATPTSTFTRGTAGTAPAMGSPATPQGNGAFQSTPTSNPSQPPASAPKVDTSASDKSVAGVNNTINQLLQLANTSPETSAAQAQLQKADQLAKLRAVDELRNNQDAALGAARSSRNRGDQALLERGAVGTSAYLGTKAQNQDVLREAELEGNQAELRATEDVNDKNARAAMLAKAGDLGLNVAALQVDISKADLTSANNYINDQFQQLGIDKQVGAQEMGQVLQFSQAMSAIKYDYDKMNEVDQQHTLDLMMNQYIADANTRVAFAQIAANHKGTLQKVTDGLLGIAQAAAPVVATAVGGPVAGAAVGAGMQAGKAGAEAGNNASTSPYRDTPGG